MMLELYRRLFPAFVVLTTDVLFNFSFLIVAILASLVT